MCTGAAGSSRRRSLSSSSPNNNYRFNVVKLETIVAIFVPVYLFFTVTLYYKASKSLNSNLQVNIHGEISQVAMMTSSTTSSYKYRQEKGYWIHDTDSDRYINNLHLSNLDLSAPAVTANTDADANGSDEVSKCKGNAVVILFGIPKQFRLVWRSYMKNIVHRNPRMKFEVYMHMYSDLHQQPFSNAKNGERNTHLDSPDDIWSILNETEDIPTILTTSLQSIFEKSELSWIQQSDTSFFTNYSFTTLQNVFRQGNSLREAFFTLQKHKNNWNDSHHVYIFARPDTFLIDPVDIPSNIGNTDVIVPSWHSWDGYNDRFAVAGPDAAKIFATKVDGYKEAILARRRWRIFEGLPPFRNSETLLKNWLLENKLNVTELEDDWAWALLRIRADGRIEPKDLDEFEIENASLVEVLASELD